MTENFVFLNVYCQSVEDEHKPRGPKGPFQFNDRSVPVLVIKDHTGKTLFQQLGWSRSPDPARLAEIITTAQRKAGPIKPAKDEERKPVFRPEKWANTEGKSMTATFVKLSEDGKTVHFKKNGRPVTVKLDQLSEDSQERIKALTSGEDED